MKQTNPQNPSAPFTCQYSSQVPELLMNLGCTIALSTYQAGKLVFISPKDENYLIQLPRNFEKPMGIAENTKDDMLALACKDEIVLFRNSPDLADHYPKSPKTYDALYMPRVTYHTGPLDIHDLSFTGDGSLIAVNTLFSCIVSIDSEYNFKPIWSPPFIDKLVSEDRCHLNGMAMQDGKPKYATAFNQGNTMQSWREKVTETGVVFDIEKNEVIVENLAMPHSPRVYNGDLYVLLSASGELVRVNIEKGTYDVIYKVDGFVRGMSYYKDYLFIGLSKLRENSSTFGKLKFAEKADRAGVLIIHLPTASLAGQIIYKTSVDEIYDVHILAGKLRPNILNTLNPNYKLGLMTPDANYWARENKN
ncbi:MAG: TIGR03032 family protein [Chitinophagales bacterium]|nr:TIGR03032 family protein [Chitinophagales bacterium]